MIGAAFTSMIPVSVVIVISAILGQGIAGFDFLALINSAMAKLVVGGSGPVARVLFGQAVMVCGNSWFECGIFYYGPYLDKYDYG